MLPVPANAPVAFVLDDTVHEYVVPATALGLEIVMAGDEFEHIN